MTKLPEGKTRLDLVRQGIATGGIKKQGRLIVSIDRLLEDPRNERKTFRNLDGLIASIQSVGLIEPITVTPEDGQGTGPRYRIITGHRRYRAAKAAGLAQVEVLIREPDDELTRRVKSIVSNVQREDVGPVEMAEALQTLLDEDQRIKTQDDLGRLIGKDKSWVSGMLRILTLPTELQHRVGTSQLPISYDSMIRIARLEDKAQQAQLIDALLHGASNRQVRQQIEQAKPGEAKSSRKAASDPKPKRVFYTTRQCTVIVQSTGSRLSGEQTVAALEEALAQARGRTA